MMKYRTELVYIKSTLILFRSLNILFRLWILSLLVYGYITINNIKLRSTAGEIMNSLCFHDLHYVYSLH
uniref:Uncharacterized protein n=1 Tax=Schistosoma curassoni TaxID=6186 RepID=A0A183K2E2_9TREM